MFVYLGEDCDHCETKLTTANDVKDMEVPEWKKKALEKGGGDATAAPFGMSWTTEGSTSATARDAKRQKNHDHGHTHEHLEHPGNFEERPSAGKRDYEERAFTVGLGGPVGSGM